MNSGANEELAIVIEEETGGITFGEEVVVEELYKLYISLVLIDLVDFRSEDDVEGPDLIGERGSPPSVDKMGGLESTLGLLLPIEDEMVLEVEGAEVEEVTPLVVALVVVVVVVGTEGAGVMAVTFSSLGATFGCKRINKKEQMKVIP